MNRLARRLAHGPAVAYGYYECQSRGDELLVQGGGGQYDDRRTYGATILPALGKGVWHDFVMYVRWDREHGVVRIWHKLATQRRFQLVVSLRGVSNIHTGKIDAASP